MIKKEVNVKRTKKPWPTKDAMEQVYEKKLWGENSTQFYSGEGSHEDEILAPYLRSVGSFLTSFEQKLTVCDLGCGDFNVGRQLVKHTHTYIAVDIAAPLITHNKESFKEEHLAFKCLDIAVDALPSGDCALVRQVLQHLSNKEVQCILDKLTSFKYVIITEHIPKGYFVPNKAIISGQGTRLKLQSGLRVLEAPFHFKVKKHTVLNAVLLKEGKGIIETSLYEMF